MLTSENIDGHRGICSAVEFVASDQILSAGDDHKLLLKDIQVTDFSKTLEYHTFTKM